jgi:hypothetical protein
VIGVTIINRFICFCNCHNYNLKRLYILTFQFYRLILLYNIAFTILTIFISFFSGGFSSGSFLFAKLVGFTGAVSLHYYSSKNTYLYFLNAGYSIKKIIACAFAVDIGFYLFIVTSIYFIKQVFTF